MAEGPLIAQFAASVENHTKEIAQNAEADLATHKKELESSRLELLTKGGKTAEFTKKTKKYPKLEAGDSEVALGLYLNDQFTKDHDLEVYCEGRIIFRQHERLNAPLATWITKMDLKIFKDDDKQVKQLTERLGYKVHFTISEASLRRPIIKKKTNAQDFLNQLFGNKNIEKNSQAHVSLECGVPYLGRMKNPHKYWRQSSDDHELKYDAGGPENVYRWDTTKLRKADGTEETDEEWEVRMASFAEQVRDELNKAMREVKAQLLAKATEVLAAVQGAA